MFKNNNLEEMIKNKKKLTSITNYNKKDYNLPDNGWLKVCYTCENITSLYIILKKKNINLYALQIHIYIQNIIFVINVKKKKGINF